MLKDKIRVGAVQYPIQGGRTFDGLMADVNAWVEKARNQNCDLVIFPELFTLDMLQSAKTLEEETIQAREIAVEYSSRYFEEISSLAKKSGLAILGGSIPTMSKTPGVVGQVVNTAILSFSNGETFFQEKLFLTWAEKNDWGWSASPGPIRVIDTPWGRWVITICYDVEVPLISQSIAEIRPELILVPSCTASIKGFHRVRWCAQARAIEHHAYVIHTGTVGKGTDTPNMNEQYGEAAFLTPSDDTFTGCLARGTPNEAALIVSDLDLALLRRNREQTKIYPARDQSGRTLRK